MKEACELRTADAFIAQYGNEAYPRAVDSTVVALRSSDLEAAKVYAAIARELLDLGYHKRAHGA